MPLLQALSVFFLLFSFFAFASAIQLYSSITPVVTNSSNGVSFHGNYSNGVESFFNIRFGYDTSGPNRFAHSKAFEYPAGTMVNASAFGAACPQQKHALPVNFLSNVTNQSEDCLNLRIDRPANTTADAKLPVMVYIYGGGDNTGQIYDSLYSPAGLLLGAAAKKIPIIYVAMNYRLGIFGFAASAALNSTDSMNSGLLDQRLAMEWVKQNIALFGGDPENITLFGESEGAASVGLHITAYGGGLSRPQPFNRAIMESGGPTGPVPGISTNITAVRTAHLIELVNCTSKSGNSSAELACLRSLPLDVLLDSAIEYELSVNPLAGFNVFEGIAHTTFIPDAPSRLLYQGKFAKNISIITGWNENDGSIFAPSTIRTEHDLLLWLKDENPGLAKATINEALALYPTALFYDDLLENVTAQYFRAAQIIRDYYFTCPSLLLAQAMANYSGSATRNYIYALNESLFEPLFAEVNRSFYSISHGSDVPFVFNEASAAVWNASVENIALGSRISGSWAAFAHQGVPVLDGVTVQEDVTLVEWEEGAKKGGNGGFELKIIGGPRAGMVRIGAQGGDGGLPSYDESQSLRCEFWNREDVLGELGV